MSLQPQTVLEDRKQKEMEFHNKLRDARLKQNQEEYDHLTSNKKYYTVTRSSREYFEGWLKERCRGKRILDYGCGDAPFSFLVAGNGAAHVTGIDISDVSVENCRTIAREKGLSETMDFQTMDCEHTSFQDSTFDIIFIAGVLHHLDQESAYKELARILKADGSIIAYEALDHNPIIKAYRLLTPHLRTEFETHHILKVGSLKQASRYFDTVQARFFHLCVLLAVPFRNTPIFKSLLTFLEAIDTILLALPIIGKNGWMMVFTLSKPKKN